MADWHLSPDQVNREFTEELLALMLRKRNERIERMNEAFLDQRPSESSRQQSRKVNDMDLFAKMGINVSGAKA